LSAKSEQQLKSYAQNMKRWLQDNEELALEDIAFTLQIGREAMDYRLAILADSREVLLQRLAGFVDNQISTGVYTAQVKKNSLLQYPLTDRRNEENLTSLPATPNASHSNRIFPNRSSGFALGTGSLGSDVAFFETDEDGQSLLHTWFQKKKLEKIAQVWVKGLNVDWMLLYGSTQGSIPTLPHRVSLPTYPFARKRHWVPASTVAQPLTPISNPLSEIVAGAPVAKGTPVVQGTQATTTVNKANQNDRASRGGTVGIEPCTDPGPRSDPAHTSRVVLRPLVDQPWPSTIGAVGSDLPQPASAYPMATSVSDQCLSQSSNNTDLALGRPVEHGQGTQTTASEIIEASPDAAQDTPVTQGTPVAQGTQATVFPQLEEELARSLANALCMEQDDIDVEKPFGEIGLDSVIGVEWIQSLNKQYACNLKASCVYDHPTIRELAGFLQEELLKHGGGIQQTPVQSTSGLSLDDMLRQVQERNLEPEKAEQLLHQHFL
jgi:acyl transferase domain-containing protein